MLLGDTLDASTQPTQTVGYTSILDSIVKAGTAFLTLEQQRDLLKVNAQRAAQNLPPLSIDQYGAGINVGLSSSTQTMLLWIAGGIGALFLVSTFVKRGR